MSIDVGVFRPRGESVQIVATTAATATAIASGTSASGTFLGAQNDETVRIINLGTSVAYVNFGGTGATVTSTTGMALAVSSNGVAGEKFGFGNYSHIAAITASGTATLSVTYGGGL
jgi:hypothetical protein